MVWLLRSANRKRNVTTVRNFGKDRNTVWPLSIKLTLLTSTAVQNKEKNRLSLQYKTYYGVYHWHSYWIGDNNKA